MRRNTLFILSLALGSALFVSPMVWADSGPRCSGKSHMMSHRGGHGHGSATGHLLRHLLKNKQEIGLSDEQVEKLRKTALDADRTHIRADADRMVSARELRSLLWDEKAELPAIEAKVKETESLEATVRIIDIKAKRELIGILTPEQKTKMKALWEQRRQEGGYKQRAEADEGNTARMEEAELADVTSDWTASPSAS
jgi:Spy/CpxP family protein refolding chaperone